MSTKASSRPRKQRHKDEMKQEIVAQVHKTIKKEASNEVENINKLEPSEDSSSRSGSNKTFIVEDKNENYSLRTPSRDISVDEETQINSKILNLIETEMKRDINKHNHFTDSRPQSLSFYEDEKIPEELSGNLELLSPEERKHYKRRKEYIDIDMERNAYNNLQDALSRENEDIITNGSTKKSKSRKKKHSTDPEVGLGDSREMMIPKEKRKSKKKKRENSPMSSSSSKRKHKKRDEEYEPRNDITLALEELQDDVFDNGVDEFVKPERIKKSPRKSEKLYVQRKNKFELNRGDSNSGRSNNMQCEEGRRIGEYHPIEFAAGVQQYWLPFTLVCHGLLGGIALSHYFYMYSNQWTNDPDDVINYGKYTDVYTCLFYFLCVICIVSVFDRYDLSHTNPIHMKTLISNRKGVIVVLVYVVCLIVHLIAARIDDKMAMIHYNLKNNYTSSNISISKEELVEWNSYSYWRAILATLGWLIVACSPQEDLFYLHLKSMIKYAPEN